MLSSSFPSSHYLISKALTGSHDRTLKIWDLQKGYCLRTIFCYSSCNDLGIARDGSFIFLLPPLSDEQGSLVISGHLDHHLRFWDVRNGELVHEMLNLHQGQITSVSIHPGCF